MKRNPTINILRALVMLLMIFVNDLWSIDGYPQWLGHSSAMQDFMGLADIVFPCFLIVVGLSIPYAIEARFRKGQSGVDVLRHILNRWLALVIMGVFTVNSEEWVHTTTGMGTAWFRILMVVGFLLVWNLYEVRSTKEVRNSQEEPSSQTHPQGSVLRNSYLVLKILGVLLLGFLAITYRGGEDAHVFRSEWWGILGIIGWTYLLCALLYLLVRQDLRWLVGIWCALVALCIVGSIKHGGGTILDLPQPNFFDQMMGALHINNGCEVALTTSGIIITVLWQKWLHAFRSRRLLAVSLCASAVMLIAGVVCDQFFITSKIMSTAPWLFYNLAIISAAYGIVACLVRARLTGWYRLISPAGSATLTCYIMPYLAYSVISLTGLQLPHWLCTGWLGILNCIAFAFLIVALTHLAGLLHIKLKI